MPNYDKKGDYNRGVNDGIKRFLMENLIKNPKNGALPRNLIQSNKKVLHQKTLSRILKKCLIMSKKDTLSKNFIKNSKNGALSRNLNKSLKRCLIKNLRKTVYKKPHHQSEKGALSKNLIKNLKVTNKASLRVY